MNAMKWLVVPAFALAACGSPSEPTDETPDDVSNITDNNANNDPVETNNDPVETNNDPVETNNANNTNSANNTIVDPNDPVTVDCVSDLVSSGGNYYALSAEVAEAGTLVEMVQYYASTPTSDPVESVIWTETVDARFTPFEFAFQVEEVYLDVQRSNEDGLYRGTMSGESQFADEVTVTCWPEDYEISANYDPTTGNCLDTDGNEAMNSLPFMYAVRTGFGQCTKFEGVLNQEALGYPVFDFIDLRGSDFNDAGLSFAELRRVQFEGADLRQFDFGYATIAGTIDEFTQLPELAECDVPDGATEFECTR